MSISTHSPSPPPAGGVLVGLTGIHADEAESKRSARADAMRTYTAILLRQDAPDPGDAAKLRAIVEAHGLSPRQIEADAADVREFLQNRAGIVKLAAAHQEVKDVRERLAAARRAVDAAEMAAAHARAHVAAAVQCGEGARHWAAMRGELFLNPKAPPETLTLLCEVSPAA